MIVGGGSHGRREEKSQGGHVRTEILEQFQMLISKIQHMKLLNTNALLFFFGGVVVVKITF